MKVLCINCNEKSDLKVGEVYTVAKHQDNFYLLTELIVAKHQDDFYLFTELIVPGFVMWYHESQFAPLSDADETDLLIKRKMNK